MRVLTAVALLAHPRSVSCRGSETETQQRALKPSRQPRPRCCLGLRTGASDSALGVWAFSSPLSLFQPVGGASYCCSRNSSCVCSGLWACQSPRGKQCLIYIFCYTDRERLPLPSPRQDKELDCLLWL